MSLEAGLAAEVEKTVTEQMTARAVGSGEVSGLATPLMIALMEEAAVKAVADRLPEGRSSVGVKVEAEHLAPTPVGMKVKARAELVEVADRRLIFEVQARDEVGEIGRGRHERFVIGLDSFEEKISGRRAGGS